MLELISDFIRSSNGSWNGGIRLHPNGEHPADTRETARITIPDMIPETAQSTSSTTEQSNSSTTEQSTSSETKLEHEHLAYVISIIRENISKLMVKKDELDELLLEMYETYRDSPEAFLDLSRSINDQKLVGQSLKNNTAAIKKPYFGKIRAHFDSDNREYNYYIGKKGVFDLNNVVDELIIDWRAPVSDLYYNSSIGRTEYLSREGIETAELLLKRTFEIENSELIAFYDSEAITNDELLIKYLSKNKDTVLNEIIATIQKDQNNIIRKEYWKNVIVQGVAGSGKTTVAMHRIAYLLYNFPEKLQPRNMYVIASSHLFVNYITSMLPELEVSNINSHTMEGFIVDFIKDSIPKFKNKKLAADTSSFGLDVIDKLDHFFSGLDERLFYAEDFTLFGMEVISQDDARYFLDSIQNGDLMSKAELLDKRITYTLQGRKDEIINYILFNRFDTLVREQCEKYMQLKSEFYTEEEVTKVYGKMVSKFKDFYRSRLKKITYQSVFAELTGVYKTDEYSLSELCLILMIACKMSRNKFLPDITHIIVDEAQDFPSFVYYCLKRLCVNARFTIVGDVMQNIAAQGIKDWNEVVQIFNNLGGTTDFVRLSKSYRNTIEISNYANDILKSFLNADYSIEPVIRHGDEVVIILNATDKAAEISRIVNETLARERQLVCIIVKDDASAKSLCKKLNSNKQKNAGNALEYKLLDTDSDMLGYGIYVCAVDKTKGLEFDTVIVENKNDYDLRNAREARLLYVAATRALHELFVFEG